MFDDKGGEMYPKSKQMMSLARGRNGKCKRMHGDRGRYLVNVGEKCNFMIPWTKVKKISLLILFKPHNCLTLATSHCFTIAIKPEVFRPKD